MCGFAGILRPNNSNLDLSIFDEIITMRDRLSHRGPDGNGVWIDSNQKIAFGHRRLSVLDLSISGNQPMISNCGKYIIVFNGEIYNHKELKQELNKHLFTPIWRGHSDTEILLACISCWGLETALEKCVGMFAFALWNNKDHILTLARDRVGEKPLFYGWIGGAFRFASELKALRVGTLWENEIDRGSLVLYLRYGYIPAPLTIYSGIYKLLPGSFLEIRPDEVSGRIDYTHPQPKRYWSMQRTIEKGQTSPFAGNEYEAVSELDSRLQTAVHQQMISDVPLGAFLSGGTDSSLIVALMQNQSKRPVKTFTVGINEKGFQEAPSAAAIARYLGTDHTEMNVTSRCIRDVIPLMPFLFDEPFADPSQLPTFLISKLTSRHVKVSLSGDGGDEIFGGYNRYFLGRDLSIIHKLLTPLGRGIISNLLRSIPQNLNLGLSGPIINRYGKPDLVSSKLRKLGEIIDAPSLRDLYLSMISTWKQPDNIALIGNENPLVEIDTSMNFKINFIEWMMCFDAVRYLPDNILVKVDRSAMASSLETRIPILDHRVIELACSLPTNYKIRGNKGKWILKKVLNKYVPQVLTDRPKMGFGVPISQWLRGPLREWGSDMLDRQKIIDDGFFDPDTICNLWREHLRGTGNYSAPLWNIIMFQVWLSHQSQ